MTKRQKIQRVIEYREDVLSQRAGVLTDSQQKLEQQLREAEAEATRLTEAANHRSDLTGHERVDVGSWLEAELWLRSRRAALELAERRVQDAEESVDQARQQVLVARMDVRRVELLDERLKDSQLRLDERLEQRLTDECALRVCTTMLRQRRD